MIFQFYWLDSYVEAARVMRGERPPELSILLVRFMPLHTTPTMIRMKHFQFYWLDSHPDLSASSSTHMPLSILLVRFIKQHYDIGGCESPFNSIG